MKAFKSIKWQLQIGYGIVLAIVLMCFAGTSYQLDRDRLFSNLNVEMNGHIEAIMDYMRSPPPPLPGEPPPQRPFPPDRPTGGLHLPPRTMMAFDETEGFYYAIWTRDGSKEFMHSTNAPTDLPTPVGNERVRMRGVYREMFTRVPAEMPPGHMLPGYMILVGRSIAPELKELHATALKLAGDAGIMLFFGLYIGWWISARAIRPIETISNTATKISAGDLSLRVNLAETESELGRLAAVLNSTFARLEAAFAQQRQFAADAAHELRTPVSVMLAQTQTALNRERSADEYRQTVEACLRSAQRMRRLIESLLELARLDAGQEPMKRMPFDLSQTVRDCVESIRPLADERSVKIHCELSPVKYMGDPGRLAQVLTNLLTNGIQYNRSGGEVRLKLESQSGLVVLTVADAGPGIAQTDLPHVFERFYRGDKSRTTSNGNAGLGLAISKAIVEAHGGTIEVASQIGQGTTFSVRLPLT